MRRAAGPTAILLVALSTLGCPSSPDTPTPVMGGNGDAATDGGPTSKVIDAGTFTIDSLKPKYQTKSAAQLANTLIACLGPGAADVTADMFIGQPAGFLPPDAFVVTTQHGVDDAVTQQKKRFDGDPQAIATGVRNDEITLEYVTALRNVANVAGKRCSATTPPPLCQCETVESAVAMITRCAPYLIASDPAVQAAANVLSARCAANKGTAIASFIASTAFAKLP